MNEGWYTDAELALLAEAAQAAPEGATVEVGVYRGRSAWVLARHARQLYLVDDLSMGDFRDEWPPAVVATDVTDLGTDGIALLHHDAAHTFDVVAAHLRLLLPRVDDGGLVCLHDFNGTSYPGVVAAWNAVARRDEWYTFGSVDSLRVFKRHG